jgi:hypothetical protein
MFAKKGIPCQIGSLGQGGEARGERSNGRVGPVGRKSRRAQRAAILVDRFRAGFEPCVRRSYRPTDLARQGRYSEVSPARPHHTSTAQIRRDTSKGVKLVTPAPRSSPYRAYSLIRPFVGAPTRPFAATPTSWLLDSDSRLLSFVSFGIFPYCESRRLIPPNDPI